VLSISLFVAVLSGSYQALSSQVEPELSLAAYDETTTTTAAPAVPTTTSTTAPPPPPTTTTAAPTTTTAPPPPPVVQPVAVAAPSNPQAKGEAALARLDYPWQSLGFSVRFEGPNPGLLGKADCGAKAITVYVRPTDDVTRVAFVTAFELGHAVDCGTMTDAKRAEWAAIRGFAPGWSSNLAPPPSAEQIAQLMPYLRPAGVA
jgi:hypothetical protein